MTTFTRGVLTWCCAHTTHVWYVEKEFFNGLYESDQKHGWHVNKIMICNEPFRENVDLDVSSGKVFASMSKVFDGVAFPILDDIAHDQSTHSSLY